MIAERVSVHAQRGLRALNAALPERERRAVGAWLTAFFPYQLEWLLDFNDFSLILKARQLGASHTLAAKLVLWSLLGETTTVISVGEREATEVVDKGELHARALARMGSEWAAPRKGEEYKRGSELRFASGGRVIALPSTSAGRGFTGNVLLDEFAYHGAHDERVWDGAAAVTMHGGRMCVCSTPNGVGNLFYELWNDPTKHRGYTLHETTIWQALEDGLGKTPEGKQAIVDKCWKMAHGDKRLFSQLFECGFLDDDQQYLPTALIEDAAWRGPVPLLDGPTFAGLDIGLENDLTALCTVQLDANGKAWVVALRVCKRTDWDEQMAMVLGAAEDWGWRRLCVDATGLGEVPARMLQKALGRDRVELVHFTQQSKGELATGMLERFANRAIAITPDDDLKHDLCAIRRIISRNGGVSYDAQRSERGHADRAWAVALALRACSPLRARGGRSDLGAGDFARTY